MSTLKLTYFDINGGRAQPIRLALHYGNIPFEDQRFKLDEFTNIKKNTPLGQVPVMEIDGLQITQSNALTRYAGRLSGLYPESPLSALLCDEILDSIEDIAGHIIHTFRLQGEELVNGRKVLIHQYLAPHLAWLESKLSDQNYFIDNQLSIADLKVIAYTTWLNNGTLEHIPTDLVKASAPKVQLHLERVINEPKIKAYYEKYQR